MILKYIGIDMSITSPGVCVLDKIGNLIYAGNISSLAPKEYKSPTYRYHSITENILHVLDIRRPKNTMIVIEDYAYGAKGRTFPIAECCGLLKYKLTFHCMVPPENMKLCCAQHLKMFVTGSGKGKKKDLMIKEVFKQWGFDTDNNDQADAFALAKIAYYTYSGIAIEGKKLEICQKIIEYNKKRQPK